MAFVLRNVLHASSCPAQWTANDPRRPELAEYTVDQESARSPKSSAESGDDRSHPAAPRKRAKSAKRSQVQILSPRPWPRAERACSFCRGRGRGRSPCKGQYPGRVASDELVLARGPFCFQSSGISPSVRGDRSGAPCQNGGMCGMSSSARLMMAWAAGRSCPVGWCNSRRLVGCV